MDVSLYRVHSSAFLTHVDFDKSQKLKINVHCELQKNDGKLDTLCSRVDVTVDLI